MAMKDQIDDKHDEPILSKRDYITIHSHPNLIKILRKQGDQEVLFADKVLKFTSSGKMKSRILLITDFAIYIVDPELDSLKRRIALAAVDKLCLSKLNDNFLAVIVPSEYDLLIASARKMEIVIAFNEATMKSSDYELEVVSSDSCSKSLVMSENYGRIALASVDKLCLSKLNDNFLAVIVPTEYDLLIASARKIEIVTAFNEATSKASGYKLEVVYSNRFEYNAASDLVKEIEFEEVEGGVKTRILRK